MRDAALLRIAKHDAIHQGKTNEAWQLIAIAAADGLDVERSSIWFLENDDTVLRCHTLFTRSERRFETELASLKASDFPSYFRALTAGRSIDASEARHDERTSEFTRTYLEPLGIHSMLDSTIRFAGRVVGVLCNEAVDAPRRWTAREAAFSAELADQASIALLNHERRAQAAALREANKALERRVEERTRLLLLERERLQEFFDNANDLIQQVDENGSIVYVNRAWKAALGYSEHELESMTIFDIVPEHHHEECQQVLTQLSAGQQAPMLQIAFLHKSGSEVPVEGSVSGHSHSDGSIMIRGIFRDIKERKIYEDKLLDLARRDGLTGLLNRRGYEELFRGETNRAIRQNNRISLLLLDIDRFKQYNDEYGHQKGDECLKCIASIVQESVQRAGDEAARYGGEEFALILPATSLEGAISIASTIHRRVAEAGLEHSTSRVADLVTVSIGLASAIPEDQDFPARLFEAADRALYRAKQTGRNRTEIATTPWDKGSQSAPEPAKPRSGA